MTSTATKRSGPPRVPGGAILWLLLLCALGCERPTGIAIVVKGLKAVPTARALLVTWQIDGSEPRQEEFPRATLQLEEGSDEARLGLRIDREVRGEVGVTVQALPPEEKDAFVLAKGAQRGTLSDLPLKLDVALKLQQVCSQSGWCWEAPLSSARLIRAMWGSGPSDIWAAGHFGLLMHYDGRYWSLVDLPPEAGEPDLFALWGSGPDDVWAVGGVEKSAIYPASARNWGVLLHFDGKAWRIVSEDPDWEYLTGVWGVQRGQVWVAGRVGTSKDSPVPAPDGVVALCTTTGCKKDEGTLLSTLLPQVPRTAAQLFDVWASGPGKAVWAVGTWSEKDKPAQGVILRRRPEGKWELVKQVSRRLSRLWGKGDEVWAGFAPKSAGPQWGGNDGGQSGLYVREAGADDTSWTERSIVDFPMPLAYDGLRRWSMKWDGTVASRIEDQSAKLFDVPGANLPELVLDPPTAGDRLPPQAPPPDLLQGLIAAGPGDVWAFGSYGLLNRYRDRGWRGVGSMPAGRLPILHGFWASGPGEAYAVGERGTILRYDGAAWSAEPAPIDGRLMGVWGAGGEAWAVGTDGRILRRAGGVWTAQPSPVQRDLFAIWGTGAGDLWAVGADGVVLRWSGTDWTLARQGGPTLLAVSGNAAPGGERWAVGCRDYGTLKQVNAAFRLEAGTWQEVAVQTLRGDGCLNSVWFDGSGAVWAGGSKETLLRYDGPQAGTWTSISVGGTRHCVGMRRGEVWCTGASTILRYDGAKRTYLEAGTDYSGWGFEGRSLFMVGDDVWSYGVGIAHCKGDRCGDPRR